jgi:branched-chain amino acid transport system permease protein
MDPTVLLQQVVNGLSIGLVYALMAIGFTLIFGVLNVVNFAHGEVYTVGAFIGLLVITALSPPLWLVLLMVLMGGGLAGYVLERVAFKPFRRFRDEASIKSKAMREATLLSSLAVSIIVREALELKFSGEMQTIAQNYLLQTPIQLGPIAITDGNLIIFGLSLVSLLALQFVLYRTRIGLAIRAVSNNVLGAQFVGIDTGAPSWPPSSSARCWAPSPASWSGCTRVRSFRTWVSSRA